MTDARSNVWVVLSGKLGGVFETAGEAESACEDWIEQCRDADSDDSPEVVAVPVGCAVFDAGHYRVVFDASGSVTAACVAAGSIEDRVDMSADKSATVTVNLNPKIHTLVHAVQRAQVLYAKRARELDSTKKPRKGGKS